MYRGRFAPSPTGPLHAGSLVAALASWLDARAHGGQWLVRVEDVDAPRSVPGATERILEQLQQCGLAPDAPPVLQSQREALYQAALDNLVHRNLAYPCCCSRKDIALALLRQGESRPRHGELVYPGTCARAIASPGVGVHGRIAWRFRSHDGEVKRATEPMEYAQAATDLVASVPTIWVDRRLGPQQQNVSHDVGDFVLKRADGCFTYQLAVVVDDAAQGITHVVRGEDLADNTARQMLLQRALDLPTPRFLHTPLVMGPHGEKLSKQNGAKAIVTASSAAALAALMEAAQVLGLPATQQTDLSSALAQWVAAWRCSYALTPSRYGAASRYTTCPDSLQPAVGVSSKDPSQSMILNIPEVSRVTDVKPFMRTIKSFVKRAGRTTAAQAKAFEALGPQFLLPYQQNAIDLVAAFARPESAKQETDGASPVVLEIGFGMGEATAHIAQVLPDTHFLCCEVHEPGVGALLKRIGENNLTNIRICAHDAVEVIDHMLPSESLDGVHIFFPDPWHKTKHNKRRLIQSPLVAKLAHRLKWGGYLHCATDWQPYAEQILEVLTAEPLLRNCALRSHPALAGYAPKPHYRPLTKFENRGIRLGHGVWDVVFERG